MVEHLGEIQGVGSSILPRTILIEPLTPLEEVPHEGTNINTRSPVLARGFLLWLKEWGWMNFEKAAEVFSLAGQCAKKVGNQLTKAFSKSTKPNKAERPKLKTNRQEAFKNVTRK